MSDRLEYLRAQLRAESISQGELLELESLADQIDPDDVELREAAGLPEYPPARCELASLVDPAVRCVNAAVRWHTDLSQLGIGSAAWMVCEEHGEALR